MQRALTYSLFSSLPLVIFGCLIPLTAEAQITPDGTTSTIVNQAGNDFTIEQGSRVGNNLFHSFNEFSVPTLGSAFFNNAGDIANIFSRVTGSNISTIDGLLSANGSANFFLINPNGIIFGENARLNLGGSFFASTADSLLFEGNAEFSASNPQAPPLLQVSIPIGINFRDNPGEIVNRSLVQNSTGDIVGLEVLPGNNFTLVGGNINLEAGKITAPGGRVNLGGLSTAGEIRIHNDDSLNFPDGRERADVTLNNQAEVNVRDGGGGFINVNARNLTLSDQSALFAGIAENAGFVDVQAGDITINTMSIVAKGNSIISTATDGIGNAGNINITTNTLEFNDEFSSEELAAQFLQDDLSSRLIASTFGLGNAGNITVNAEGNISFDGSGGGILTTVGVRGNDNNITNVRGHAGDILVNANSVSITDGAGFIVSTIGKGNGGNILINARNSVTLDGLGDPIPQFGNFIRPSGLKTQVRTNAVGDAGTIEINTNVLSSKRANILTDTNGIGDAGDIIINAANSINFEGIEGVRAPFSVLLTQVGSRGQGEGGELIINTKDIRVVDSFLSTDSDGIGNAGEIFIKAQDLTVIDSFLSTDSDGIGNAGEIFIKAQDLTVIDSFLSTDSGERGNAGEIYLKTLGDISLENSRLTAQVLRRGIGYSGNLNIESKSLTSRGSIISVSNQGRGNAGNIRIDAIDSIVLDSTDQTIDGLPSLILSQSQENNLSLGEGGDITIFAQELTLINGAKISTENIALGQAGNLNISTANFLKVEGLNSGLFSRTGGLGDAGTVNIITNELIVQGNGQIGVNNFIETGIRLETLKDESGNPILDPNGNPIKITVRQLDFNPVRGSGNAGSLNIKADTIQLEDRGSLTAISAGGDGGNININIDFLRFRNGGNISAQAGLENTLGSGGNINIDSTLILAFPNENSDITANAFEGRGGNIEIFTEGIFGLTERSSTPPNITNDIDASSEFGLQGNVSINTPEVDPTSGLIELPETVVDATDQISQNICEQGVGSEFIITGKGGLPPNPNKPLNSDEEQVGLVETVPLQRQIVEANDIRPNNLRSEKPASELVPAQGWIFNDKGEVTLTSYKTPNTETKPSPQQKFDGCSNSMFENR